MSKKMGRPKMPRGTAKRILFAFKIAKVESDQICEAIKRSGLEKAEWARRALLSAANSESA